jgi:hypothetical protein
MFTTFLPTKTKRVFVAPAVSRLPAAGSPGSNGVKRPSPPQVPWSYDAGSDQEPQEIHDEAKGKQVCSLEWSGVNSATSGERGKPKQGMAGTYISTVHSHASKIAGWTVKKNLGWLVMCRRYLQGVYTTWFIGILLGPINLRWTINQVV